MCKTSPDSMGTASNSVISDSHRSNKIACIWRKALLRLKSRRSRKACTPRQQEFNDKDHRNTIDDEPCDQMPPPLDAQEECPSHDEHPMVVYICNPPMAMGRPSSMQHADRVTSALSVLDDDASQDSDNGDLPSPPSSQHVASCQSSQNISTVLPKPLSMSSRRVSTYGSTTTQSSRHRRLALTVSPSSLRQVYDSVEDGSQDSPFPELSKIDGSVSGDSSVRPKIVDTTEPCLAESEKWMEGWAAAAAAGGGQAKEPIQEKRDEISVDNETGSEQIESTYLPKCPWLEHAFLSSGSKIIFAGWVLYSPNDVPVRNHPVRQDILYVILLENVPKIYLARDKDQDMSTIDVSPTMRVQIKDISKSHGRGVVLCQDGVAHGTFVPISLPSFMFQNQSLVDDDEFEDLAYRTIAPFRRASCTNSPQWCHAEYHQQYAPVAQLEAAMHLMFVMDSWMTKMLKR